MKILLLSALQTGYAQSICGSCETTGFTTEPSINFGGLDLEFLSSKAVDTVTECASACDANVDCVGFTVNPKDDGLFARRGNNRRNGCYLKQKIGTESEMDNRVSGRRCDEVTECQVMLENQRLMEAKCKSVYLSGVDCTVPHGPNPPTTLVAADDVEAYLSEELKKTFTDDFGFMATAKLSDGTLKGEGWGGDHTDWGVVTNWENTHTLFMCYKTDGTFEMETFYAHADADSDCSAKWLEWSEWAMCSQTCGSGERSRLRECKNGSPGESGCEGAAQDSESCNEHVCPAWREWSEWSSCSLSCDTGSRSRSRDCENGDIGDVGCEGEHGQSEKCNEQVCPAWDAWSNWSTCSLSCNTGSRSRSRACLNGDVGQDGCAGEGDQSEICNEIACPIWSEWTEWGECSTSCGGGSQSRAHTCINGTPGQDGCIGDLGQSRDCNEKACPVWASWGHWNLGECSQKCDSGSKKRSRGCDNGEVGDLGCDGDAENTEDCVNTDCRCGDLFTGDANSGCFAIVEGECLVANDECLKLECGATAMKGTVRSDLLNRFPLDVNVLQLNGEKCESSSISFDSESDEFTFDLNYGDCMTSSMDDEHIRFQTALGMPVMATEKGIFLSPSFSNGATFTCAFASTATTEEMEYTVSTSRDNFDIEQKVQWDAFDFSFFKSDAFEDKIDESDEINIGESIFMNLEWENVFGDNFPVKYYVNTCTVSSDGKSYNVIEAGCGDADVGTTMLSDDAYQTSQVRWSWKSFSFVEEVSAKTHTVSCEVKFCLQESIEDASCGFEQCV